MSTQLPHLIVIKILDYLLNHCCGRESVLFLSHTLNCVSKEWSKVILNKLHYSRPIKYLKSAENDLHHLAKISKFYFEVSMERLYQFDHTKNKEIAKYITHLKTYQTVTKDILNFYPNLKYLTVDLMPSKEDLCNLHDKEIQSIIISRGISVSILNYNNNASTRSLLTKIPLSNLYISNPPSDLYEYLLDSPTTPFNVQKLTFQSMLITPDLMVILIGIVVNLKELSLMGLRNIKNYDSVITKLSNSACSSTIEKVCIKKGELSMGVLCEFLHKSKVLKYLSLSSVDFIQTRINTNLLNSTSLESLEICGKYTDFSKFEILNSLSILKSVRNLSIQHSLLYSTIRNIGGLLQTNLFKNLQEFTLVVNSIFYGDNSPNDIIGFLNQLVRLNIKSLKRLQILEKSSEEPLLYLNDILESLKFNNTLDHLKICNATIYDFARFCQMNHPSIRTFHVENMIITNTDDYDVEKVHQPLVTVIGANQTLEYLTIDGYNALGAPLDVILGILRNNHILISLQLHTQISPKPQHINEFTEVLNSNQTILNLSKFDSDIYSKYTISFRDLNTFKIV
ncbi:hypothetical protein DLAC_10380 [Tieghemostelium lacteum]|uniref:F-box domain-containing protein n=1 Tax=Tieghemostelium lacteum TaxID=361077 RepID=A0A151Z598_TIELA|nr:hypothetical protein DLAC_10380 [Tieghemostelium lacteum]|eukprot:KYQ89140.1 hypothetical protein DLAC_10380 [Tieghemostelium lacteum]